MKSEAIAAPRAAKKKEINSMFTSIQDMARKSDHRYDAEYLYYCISRLNEIYGQSKRFVMCKLIEAGLKNHPLYSGNYDELREEYEKKRQEFSK